MTEFAIFLAELVLLLVAAGLAAALPARPGARLAAGVYWLATGVGLCAVPLAAWDVARTDNAFLGLYLLGALAALLGAGLTAAGLVALRDDPRRGSTALRAAAAALGAVALALGWLALRGPGAWATGSGQFGLDVAAVWLLLAGAAYAVGGRLGRPELSGLAPPRR